MGKNQGARDSQIPGPLDNQPSPLPLPQKLNLGHLPVMSYSWRNSWPNSPKENVRKMW